MKNLYHEVTERILGELKKGAVPWVKPWSVTAGRNMPHNAATRRPYSGVNVVLLWIEKEAAGWAVPAFLTFKQAKVLGGSVRKGEHGTKIYFVKKLFVKDKNAPADAVDDVKAISMLREYTVFNIAQCDGLPERIVNPAAKAPNNSEERDATIDEFLAATGADIRDGGAEAYFVPSRDFILMPAFAAFKSKATYYATVFHELGHWTGHKSRLDRDEGMKSRFGDRVYAAEELVAELTSAFLCAEFSVDGELRQAGYIAHWIELLKHDDKAFMTAASRAQKAVDFLRHKILADEKAEVAEELAA